MPIRRNALPPAFSTPTPAATQLSEKLIDVETAFATIRARHCPLRARRDATAERRMTLEELRGLIYDVPDFPKPGIVFKDITPLLQHPAGFRETIDRLAQGAEAFRAEHILAIESRGFIFGAALANRLGLPMHLVRKRGKLPREAVSIRYEPEYGADHRAVPADTIRPNARYMLVADVIATGRPAAATGPPV